MYADLSHSMHLYAEGAGISGFVLKQNRGPPQVFVDGFRSKMMLQAVQTLLEHSVQCLSMLKHGFRVCFGTGDCTQHCSVSARIFKAMH